MESSIVRKRWGVALAVASSATALALARGWRREHKRPGRAAMGYADMRLQRDVAQTAQRQSGEQIAGEGRFRVIFDQSAVGIERVGLQDGRLVEVNPQLCRMLGYQSDELLAKTFWCEFHQFPPALERLLDGVPKPDLKP